MTLPVYFVRPRQTHPGHFASCGWHCAPDGTLAVPEGIDAADALVFDWTDGARTVHPFRELRLRCPCARCVDEWDGHALLDPASVPASVRPDRVTAVGRYAVRILWSDGHGTGIYSYDHLRRLAAPGA